MSRKFPILLLALTIAACAPRTESAWDLLNKKDTWTLAGGDEFADGGSLCLSFINRNGEIIHLWAQAPVPGKPELGRSFFIQRTYDDPKKIEVLPNSKIENEVLSLLTSYRRRSWVTIPDSYPTSFAASIQDRRHPLVENGAGVH
jgi:hypothetical protein